MLIIKNMKISEVWSMARKFSDIVEFSGVERFIDTPVKHYSSGMYVRLAFAVALDDGLQMPVIKGAEGKGVRELTAGFPLPY